MCTSQRPVAAASRSDLRVVLLHHLATGSAVAVCWLALLPLGTTVGAPPVLVLLLVVALVLPVVAGTLLVRRLAAEGLLHGADRDGPVGRALLLARVRQRLGLQRPTRRQLVRTGLPALVAALLLPGLGLPAEAALHRAGWFSAWPSTGLPALGPGHGQLHGPGAAGVLAVWVAVAVVAGPLVEEVLFRGLLQPLLPGGPWGRVVLGSALFAVYHLGQPATWATVLLATLPAAWARERTGSTWVAVGVHVAANGAALVLLLAGGLDR